MDFFKKIFFRSVSIRRLVLVLLMIMGVLFSDKSIAQQKDTTSVREKKTKDPRPRNAAIRSAILPGLGQVYNKKYWKVPIIYGAGTTIALFYFSNQKNYANFRDLAKANPSITAYKTNRDTYRGWRDWNIVMFVGLYVLQIIDANVDAHLREFDVGEDLAFSIKPYLCPVRYADRSQPVSGISLNLRFKK